MSTYPVSSRNGIATAALGLLARRLLHANVLEQVAEQPVAGAALEQERHRRVDGVLVLLEPAVDGVGDNACGIRE